MTASLELIGIAKSYGGLTANRDVSVRFAPGTVHAVVGENGAGKSTLFHIAYGSTRADAGRIRIKGTEIPIARHSPAGAIAAGVGMVHQHFMLVPTLSVVENVVLGREPTRRGLLDLGRAASEIAEIARKLDRELDPRRRIDELPIGEQQYVEIVKILWRGADVLLLDEPTAVLTPGEVGALFRVLRALAAEGKTVVLVTHKLDEVAAIADRVTVMRRGEVVAELADAGDRDAIAKAMIGGGVEAPRATARPIGDEIMLDVDGLVVRSKRGRAAVRGATFRVRAGEIVGVAGVQGNGQSELVSALAGLTPVSSGHVKLGGVDVTWAKPRARAARGLAHIPEDRRARGLVLDFDIAENLLLGRQRELSGTLGLDRARIDEYVVERIRALDIRPPDRSALASSLSGGNQQKLVVARELGRPSLRLIVAAEPTRGVDIAASAEIHRRLFDAAERGAGVLVVSSDLAELRALAHRILVLYRGVVVCDLAVLDATDDVLGAYMTGARGRTAVETAVPP